MPTRQHAARRARGARDVRPRTGRGSVPARRQLDPPARAGHDPLAAPKRIQPRRFATRGGAARPSRRPRADPQAPVVGSSASARGRRGLARRRRSPPCCGENGCPAERACASARAARDRRDARVLADESRVRPPGIGEQRRRRRARLARGTTTRAHARAAARSRARRRAAPRTIAGTVTAASSQWKSTAARRRRRPRAPRAAPGSRPARTPAAASRNRERAEHEREPERPELGERLDVERVRLVRSADGTRVRAPTS